MVNKAPGAPNLSVLSFMNGFHGRTMGMSAEGLLLGVVFVTDILD